MITMVNNGNIVRTRKGLYGPAEEMNLITGYFEAHRDGYGFVILEKHGERDVFIHAMAPLGAMDNDRVIARIENRGRREGAIIGLASESYSHFTSPIRRYSDLVVHRILREVLTKRHLCDKRINELKSLLPVLHSIHRGWKGRRIR